MSTLELIQVGLVRDAPDQPTEPITNPKDVLPHVSSIAHSDREHFVCLHLDARNQPRNIEIVSTGSLSASIVHPREVFKAAILSNAAAVIFSHNHPSGNPSPSPDDINLTRRLVKAGELLGINVLDHLIVSPDGSFHSMKESGMI